MKRVALMLFGVTDLSGGGGMERFYSSFFNKYVAEENPFDLFVVGDATSIRYLTQHHFLAEHSNILSIPKELSSNFKNHVQFIFPLINILKQKNIDVLHIPTALSIYLPFLSVVRWLLPHIKLSFNVINCEIAPNYFSKNKHVPGIKSHRRYLQRIRFDGILSWYKNIFSDDIKQTFRGKPYLFPVNYCFTETDKFKPEEKQNHIVFAARLSLIKDPLFYLNAILILKTKQPSLFSEWTFYLYGKGELEAEVKAFLKKNDLSKHVILGFTNKMNEVLNKSKLFISTQNHENFTSISMLEAMASGNAIIARNVGQTEYFVKDGKNGFLLEEDTPECLSEKILEYISTPSLQTKMSAESIHIAKNVHTYENFRQEINAYWANVAKQTEN